MSEEKTEIAEGVAETKPVTPPNVTGVCRVAIPLIRFTAEPDSPVADEPPPQKD